MRIAMIGQKGLPATYGGPERHVEELARRLVERGHSVRVYVRTHYGQRDASGRFLREHRGIELRTRPSLPTKHLDAITHTAICTLDAIPGRFDIVHYHALGPSTLGALPRLFGACTVATVHGLDWKRAKWGPLARAYLRFGEFAAARFVNGTICVSRTLAAYFKDRYGIAVSYIPNGIDIPLALPGSRQIEEQFGLTPGGYYLYLARLVPEKGCHYLISAYRSIETRRRLVITGGSAFTDEYVRRLHELAAGDPRILFTGFQYGEALAGLFAHAYLYVLPSDLEGLPITLLQALAHGAPVLVSDLAENLEVVGPQDQEPPVAMVFRAGSVEDLGRALTEAEQRGADLGAMARRGRSRVERQYRWDRIAEQTEACYRRLLSQPLGPP